MKKPVIMLMVRPSVAVLLILLFLAGTAVPPLSAEWRGRTGPLSGYRVLIDPGHGGIDPGTGAQLGMLEKDINLDVAHRLRRRLTRTGAFVDLTRWRDQELSFLLPHAAAGRHGRDLRGRVHLSDAFNASLLISLHVNYSRSSDERGSIVFYCRGSAEGQALGEAIQRRLLAVQPYSRQKALPNSSLRVLTSAPCPSVLVEMGFLSNPDDRALLGRSDYRERLARAIGEGVLDYAARPRGRP